MKIIYEVWIGFKVFPDEEDVQWIKPILKFSDNEDAFKAAKFLYDPKHSVYTRVRRTVVYEHYNEFMERWEISRDRAPIIAEPVEDNSKQNQLKLIAEVIKDGC